MSGIGDFFQIPSGGGGAQAFYQQQIESGGMAVPPLGSPASGVAPVGDHMDETALYTQAGASAGAGVMPWERGPAPWEQVPAVAGPAALAPGSAEAAIQRQNAIDVSSGEAKAVEAAQAAKIAADNAVRAAVSGAPKVAATNAATAQAAANVAAMTAKTTRGQQAAALAQSEATKAVAAANVAAKNAAPRNGAQGVGDWMELSGMGGMGGMGFFGTDLGGGIKIGHVVAGLGLGAGLFYAVKRFAK